MRHYRFGQGKWVFIDWLGIDAGYGTAWGGAVGDGHCMPEGLELRVHEPRVEPGPVLAGDPDHPWERHGIAFANVLADGGRFRCWYVSICPAPDPKYKLANRMGYAESDDGVTWRKPTLHLREFAGSTANNLTQVTGRYPSQYGLVFRDPSAAAAARYKLVAPGGRHGLVGAWSADGLHFTSYDEPILPANNTDTDDTGWYNPQTGRYAVYTRQRDNLMGRRGINRSESADFAHFPPSTPILESSPLDPPDWDLYTNAFLPWPGAVDAYLMRPAIFKRSQDITEIHLATSRDELLWHRPQGRQPWLTLDSARPRYQDVYMCGGVLPTAPGEWSQYLTAWEFGHNEVEQRLDRLHPVMMRATLREDGFMSLSAAGHGQCWTIPFTCTGGELRLNLRTRYSGYLRAALSDVTQAGRTGGSVATTAPLDGFTLADCAPLSGDHLRAPLCWQGGSSLAALAGRQLQLHLQLFKADLFALDFTAP